MKELSVSMKRFAIALLAIGLLSFQGCEDKKHSAAKRRTFVKATGIRVEFSYDDEDPRVASSAVYKTSELGDEKTVVATAKAKGFIVLDDRLYNQVEIKLIPRRNATCVSTVLATFQQGSGDIPGSILKTLVDGKWESCYTPVYGVGQHFGPFNIITYDLETRKKVAETIVRGHVSNGDFFGEEVCYEKGNEVFRSDFVRNGAGILVSENVKHGVLHRDYHHYELVVMGWAGL